jgi:hypothetical protein
LFVGVSGHFSPLGPRGINNCPLVPASGANARSALKVSGSAQRRRDLGGMSMGGQVKLSNDAAITDRRAEVRYMIVYALGD